MSDTLYPIFYGTRMVDFETLEATFKPKMHPEAWRRAAAFIKHHNGLFGIGGGWRPVGGQPDKPGFAKEGESFHQSQQFPSGKYYAAFDMVCVNPGGTHRAPAWNEVPVQGSVNAVIFGFHMNVDQGAKPESWHGQPIELDGWRSWVNAGRPDIQADYPIAIATPPLPPVPQPPVPENPVQTEGVIVQVQSRNLIEGTSGTDVKFFQRILNDVAGQGLLLDGGYGPKTTTAVKNWQTVFGLKADGQMGPKTQQSLIEQALLH